MSEACEDPHPDTCRANFSPQCTGLVQGPTGYGRSEDGPAIFNLFYLMVHKLITKILWHTKKLVFSYLKKKLI